LLALGKSNLYRAKILAGEVPQAFDLETLVPRSGCVKACEAWLYNNIGDILAHLDRSRYPEAELWFHKALSTGETNGTMFHVARAHALYSELLRKKGDHTSARNHLGKAVEIFKNCGSEGWVNKYENQLVSI
jgi:tetratricopeptide (TPR) repeat protein